METTRLNRSVLRLLVSALEVEENDQSRVDKGRGVQQGLFPSSAANDGQHLERHFQLHLDFGDFTYKYGEPGPLYPSDLLRGGTPCSPTLCAILFVIYF